MDTLYIINYDSKKHQSWRFKYLVACLVGMHFSFALYLLELEKRVILSKLPYIRQIYEIDMLCVNLNLVFKLNSLHKFIYEPMAGEPTA